MKILPSIFLIPLLVACSQTDQKYQLEEPTILSVNKSCSMLGLEMTNWKSSAGDGIYRCISNYIDISPDNGTKLPNNLAYYVQGTENTVNELKIVLNVNDKSYRKKAENEFIMLSSKVYKNINPNELPSDLINAISSKKNYSISDENFTYSIENEDFENGKGFTQKFIIRLK
ncbi:DUF6030 family protein [Acinetobacter haemolyticus]|uniref:Lipoprotein n=1 Tax=Acinetobacter haemolyticus TaxID=29430 RepID=A0A4P7B531_ACIHA|nr:DUF6030 family protein [Acinetobacter haemolyticus]QBQ16807.1 hypothetical protein AHTJR_11215 [Acinetobacter haemolyticus]